MKLDIHCDRELTRAAATNRRHIVASIEAPHAAVRSDRAPVNLAFVIDRSGSMCAGKLGRVKQAVRLALSALGNEDHFSVVAYDHEVDVLVPSCLASPANRARADLLISCLEPRGATDLFGGCLAGCEQVAMNLEDGEVGRCLLLTDGLANRGLTDHHEISQHMAALRERAIATTTFGVGADFDESLLRRMAESGGGNFYFIETAEQVADTIAGEVGEALEVVARDATLILEARPGATVTCLNDYPVRHDGVTWCVELGSLVAGQLLDVVLGVRLPPASEGSVSEITLRLEDPDCVLDAAARSVRFTSAGDDDVDAQPRDRAVDRKVARLLAARASRDALEYNRQHDYSSVRKVLDATSSRIRSFAGDDEVVAGIAYDLEERRAAYARAMDPATRKRLHSGYYAYLRDKEASGRSTRRPVVPGVVVVPASREVAGACERAWHALRSEGARILRGIELAPALRDMGLRRPKEGDLLDPSLESRWVEAAHSLCPSAEVRILVTQLGLPDRWFSHWHERERTAVVSTQDWDRISTVPLEALIAYETLLYGLSIYSPDEYPLALVHGDTRGCLFDLCALKTDIEIKLQTMDICEPCRTGLIERRVAPDAVSSICEVVRSLARPI